MENDINDEACELVNGVELSIGEGTDSINAHLFKAVKNNNGTGLLLLSDIFGFEDTSTRDFAYRVACNGYKYAMLLNFRLLLWENEYTNFYNVATPNSKAVLNTKFSVSAFVTAPICSPLKQSSYE